MLFHSELSHAALIFSLMEHVYVDGQFTKGTLYLDIMGLHQIGPTWSRKDESHSNKRNQRMVNNLAALEI